MRRSPPADRFNTLGTPPASVPRPADGYWWVRFAEPREFRGKVTPENGTGQYSTWDNPVTYIRLVHLTRSTVGGGREEFTDWMGTDEADDLESPYRRLIEVIAKIEEPT